MSRTSHRGTDLGLHRAFVEQLATRNDPDPRMRVFSVAHLVLLAGKMQNTTIAGCLVAEEFTISVLRGVYTAVWQAELPAGNFTRKMRPTPTPTAGKIQAVGAPASLFTVGSEWISPPLPRPAHRAGEGT